MAATKEKTRAKRPAKDVPETEAGPDMEARVGALLTEIEAVGDMAFKVLCELQLERRRHFGRERTRRHRANTDACRQATGKCDCGK